MLRHGSVVALVVIGLSVVACGQYAPGGGSGPSPNPTQSVPAADGPPDDAGASSEPEGGIPATFAWGLPPSDTSLTGNDGPAYQALRDGCSAAEQFLASTAETPFTSNPYGFLNARYTEFYAAGIALCRGDIGTARTYRDHAVARWGTEGIDRPGDPKAPDGTDYSGAPRPPGYGEPECDLYRTLGSVLDQVAPDSIVCPGGDRPGHIFVDYVVDDGQGPYTTSIHDDPVTLDVEEQLIAPPNAVEPKPQPTEPAEDEPEPEPEVTAEPSAPPATEVSG